MKAQVMRAEKLGLGFLKRSRCQSVPDTSEVPRASFCECQQELKIEANCCC